MLKFLKRISLKNGIRDYLTINTEDMKKQTALQMAITHCEKLSQQDIIKFIQEYLLEIEKQQIIEAYLMGFVHSSGIKVTIQAEQYYNETFKSKDQ